MSEMPGEMVECVARALQAEHHGSKKLRPSRFAGVPSFYEDMALAAIAAMREPTPAMVRAARLTYEVGDGLDEVWQAMIAVALGEGR